MYNKKKQEEFANLIRKIDFRDPNSREVFAKKILEEVRDRVADEDISPLIAEVRTFPADAQAGFKYKRGLVAHVIEPGSYVPRSRPGQTVQMITPLTVAVAPEIELDRLNSGDFESAQEMIDMATAELKGKRTSLIWNALDSSLTNTSATADYGVTTIGLAKSATVTTKQAALDDAIDTVSDTPANVKAIIGRRSAVSWIQSISDYAEITKERRDRGVLTEYRGIPIVTLKNYVDAFDQSRISNDRFFVIGDDSIKVGFTQELQQLDGIDVDTATWHARLWERYGILVLFASHNVKIIYHN